MLFENIDQANQHLRGVVVPYGQLPCYFDKVFFDDEMNEMRGVCKVFKDNDIGMEDLPNSVLDLTSEHFNKFIMPSLGWVNWNPHGNPLPSYINRIPVRRVVRGFNSSNTVLKVMDAAGTLRVERNGGGRPYHMFNSGIEEMLKGQYPTLADVKQRAVDGSGAALSTEYAVVKGLNGMMNVFRHTENIGFILGNTFHLQKDMYYLLEELEGSRLFITFNIQRIE